MSPNDEPIYLDNAASSAPDEQVVDAMLPWLREFHGNPHARNVHGYRAAAALEEARDRIASLIGAEASEVILTSGATESNNLAIAGLLRGRNGRRLLGAASIEHSSILEVARVLASEGVHQFPLPIDEVGAIDVGSLSRTLAEIGEIDLGVIAAAHGNGELGTVQDLAGIAMASKPSGYFVHVDASQTLGKIAFDVTESGANTVTVSSHKLGGPGGIGALFVTSELQDSIRPIMSGGSQERNLRPGSVPVFLAVGFGMAAKLACEGLSRRADQLRVVESAFLYELGRSEIRHSLVMNRAERIPGHLSIQFSGLDAGDLLDVVSRSISASTGAACASGELRSSHVLRAIGLDEESAASVVRVTFGARSSVEEAISSAQAFIEGARQVGRRGSN